MRNADTAWVDPTYAREPIENLVNEWIAHLESRPTPVSPATVTKYRNSLSSFMRSIVAADEPTNLANLTRFAVDRWVSQQRLAGRSGEGIASRLAALKAFTRAYLWLEGEYTTADLLAKIKRVKAPPTAKPGLDQEERDAVFAVFDGGGYQDVRNDAFVTVSLATGLRYSAVLGMTLERFDRSSGMIVVTEKGGVERPAQLGGVALKKVRRWLRIRRAEEGVGAFWTTDDGRPLSYWGGRSMFTRLKKRSGVARVHPHLFRHTAGQHAIEAGADPTLVQDMLGHKTADMTRRYTATVRAANAAKQMPRFSVI